MSGDKKNLRQDEGALRILEALSAVDEELLKRSGAPASETDSQQAGRKVTDMSYYGKRRRPLWQYGRVGAACLALIVVGALSWNGLQMIWGPAGAAMDSSSSGGSSQTENQAAGGGSTGAAAVNDSDGASMNGGVGEMDAGTSVTESYREEISGESQMQESEAEKSLAEEPRAEESQAGSSGQMENSTASRDNIIEEDGSCPLDNRREITEKEARTAEVLGAYLPAKLPAGYVFEIARIDDQGQLTAWWLHGMDTIFISVTFAEAEGFETVDVSRPETYDEWLYGIPYAETVPEEYWETFNNPVFAAEDLSLEVVGRRMKVYEDAGDTDTPRGSFSILYPEGVLVRFNGRGTAEEIWNMFHSLPQ